jgi:hypothetical protein
MLNVLKVGVGIGERIGQTMSKEKQIEEMAKVLCGMKNGCDGCMWDKVHCNERNYAEEIYNAGYRKQSEGEWIDKPTGAYSRMQSWCSDCGKHSGIGGIESNRHKPYCPNCGAKMKGGE